MRTWLGSSEGDGDGLLEGNGVGPGEEQGMKRELTQRMRSCCPYGQ